MLQIKHLSVQFPSKPRPVLEDFCLEVAAGEFCVIIGKNGSGKSTLFAAILGLHSSQGEITLAAKPLTSLAPYERARCMGVVAQDADSSSIASLSLLENLTLASMRRNPGKLRPALQPQRFFEHPLLSDLREFANEPLGSLSGGQRQRLALAMALLSKPNLLLLDEHCSALDPRAAHSLMAITAQTVSSEGITTLMITHSLQDALGYGSRLLVLDAGKLVLDVKGSEKHKLREEDLFRLFSRELP